MDRAVQYGFLGLIRRSPGLKQKDLAERRGMSPENFKYHAHILAERGLIFTRADGKKKLYYPKDTGGS